MSDNKSKLLYISFNLFNIIDIIFTLNLIGMDGLYEGNPLMGYLLQLSPYLFIMVKLILGIGCSSFLYKHRSYLTAKIGLIVGSLTYLGLAIWHCYVCYVLFMMI